MFMRDHARKGFATWNCLLPVLIIVLLSISASGQGVCPIETIRVNKLSGQIVENSKAKSPWPNILVELRSSREGEPLISTARTDENGLFRFAPSKTGTYFLHVDTQHFPRYRLVIKFKGPSRHTKGGGFRILLDPDCGKTEVYLGK